jgi:hypothetical protein
LSKESGRRIVVRKGALERRYPVCLASERVSEREILRAGCAIAHIITYYRYHLIYYFISPIKSVESLLLVDNASIACFQMNFSNRYTSSSPSIQERRSSRFGRNDLRLDVLIEKTNLMGLPKQRADTAETEATLLSPRSEGPLSSKSEFCLNSPRLEILSSSDDDEYLIWYSDSQSTKSVSDGDYNKYLHQVFLFPDEEEENCFEDDEDENTFLPPTATQENFVFHNLSEAAAARKEFFLCHVPDSIAEGEVACSFDSATCASI